LYTTAYEKLQALHDKFKPARFGKIAQKLLALSFLAAGYRVVEREVQGVDIDAEGAGGRYAVEVKTTRRLTIHVDDANIGALRDRAADNYSPSIAVLRVAPLCCEWLIAVVPIEELSVGNWPVDRFRAYRASELEKSVNGRFALVVSEWFRRLLDEGTDDCLDQELKQRSASKEGVPPGGIPLPRKVFSNTS